MKLGIMQPYFFPYIGYWQLINAVDKYVIYDDVNFIKGGWINRNKILLNGRETMVNLRMHGASSNKHINQIEVLGDPVYNKKFLTTIQTAYKKAPCFGEVFPVIVDIIQHRELNLAEYLANSIRTICEFLQISTKLLISSKLEKKVNLHGQNRVIDICSLLGAKTYINSIGGQKLYSYSEFAKHDIDLFFLQSETVQYEQFNCKFVPNLSIIDVMMFNSVEQIKTFLEKYTLHVGGIE